MFRRLLFLLLTATPCLAQSQSVTNLQLKLPQNPNWTVVPCLDCPIGGSSTGTAYFAGFGLTLSAANVFAINPGVVLLNGSPEVNGQSIVNGGNITVTGLVYSAGTGILLSGSAFSIDPAVVYENGSFTINVNGGPTNTVGNGGSITIPATGGGAVKAYAKFNQTGQQIVSAGGFTNVVGLGVTIVPNSRAVILVAFSCNIAPSWSTGNQMQFIVTCHNAHGTFDVAGATIQADDGVTADGGAQTVAITTTLDSTDSIVFGTNTFNVQASVSGGSVVINPQNNINSGSFISAIEQ